MSVMEGVGVGVGMGLERVKVDEMRQKINKENGSTVGKGKP